MTVLAWQDSEARTRHQSESLLGIPLLGFCFILSKAKALRFITSHMEPLRLRGHHCPPFLAIHLEINLEQP